MQASSIPRLQASVAEWSIATDCKSVDLWSTKVRILPGAQNKKLAYRQDFYFVVLEEGFEQEWGRERSILSRGGRQRSVGKPWVSEEFNPSRRTFAKFCN